jgi:hypothetical protein
MAFPGGPLPSPIPDRRKTPPAGDRLRGRNLLSGTTFCLMGELSFSLLLYLRVFAVPGVQPLNRHTCGVTPAMYNGCRTFSGHPPCWSRSLSPHMGGRSHPCATKASPESPLRDAGTVPCGAETQRGRSHPCTPLVAVTADQAPCAKPPLPNRPHIK